MAEKTYILTVSQYFGRTGKKFVHGDVVPNDQIPDKKDLLNRGFIKEASSKEIEEIEKIKAKEAAKAEEANKKLLIDQLEKELVLKKNDIDNLLEAIEKAEKALKDIEAKLAELKDDKAKAKAKAEAEAKAKAEAEAKAKAEAKEKVEPKPEAEAGPDSKIEEDVKAAIKAKAK